MLAIGQVDRAQLLTFHDRLLHLPWWSSGIRWSEVPDARFLSVERLDSPVVGRFLSDTALRTAPGIALVLTLREDAEAFEFQQLVPQLGALVPIPATAILAAVQRSEPASYALTGAFAMLAFDCGAWEIGFCNLGTDGEHQDAPQP